MCHPLAFPRDSSLPVPCQLPPPGLRRRRIKIDLERVSLMDCVLTLKAQSLILFLSVSSLIISQPNEERNKKRKKERKNQEGICHSIIPHMSQHTRGKKGTGASRPAGREVRQDKKWKAEAVALAPLFSRPGGLSQASLAPSGLGFPVWSVSCGTAGDQTID